MMMAVRLSRPGDQRVRLPATIHPEVIMLGSLARLGLIASLWLPTQLGTTQAQESGGTKEVRYRESRTAIANPDRGFYAARMSGRMNGLEGLRARGITLLLVEMDLRDFKDREISPEKLAELRRVISDN